MKTAALFLSVVLLTGCAGMDYQYQRNMAANAAGYGLAGAATGAILGAATGGNVGAAAAIGGVAGAALGAANTPPPPQQGQPGAYAYLPSPPVYYYPSYYYPHFGYVVYYGGGWYGGGRGYCRGGHGYGGGWYGGGSGYYHGGHGHGHARR